MLVFPVGKFADSGLRSTAGKKSQQSCLPLLQPQGEAGCLRHSDTGMSGHRGGDRLWRRSEPKVCRSQDSTSLPFSGSQALPREEASSLAGQLAGLLVARGWSWGSGRTGRPQPRLSPEPCCPFLVLRPGMRL